MPTADNIKSSIDVKIINKTQPYSINHTEVGNILKEVVDFANSQNTSKTEEVQFADVPFVVIAWTDERRGKFGNGASFIVEWMDDDGVIRQIPNLEIKPDSLVSTTQYRIDFGINRTGRVLIK